MQMVTRWNWGILALLTAGALIVSPAQAISRAALTTATDSTLSAPVLLVPADGDTTEGQDTTLFWSGVPGARSYRVQVTTDSSFAYFVPFEIDTAGVGDTTLSLSSFLGRTVLAGKRYYWRVSAEDSSGYGPYSNASSFYLKYSFTQSVADSLDSTFSWFQNNPPDSTGSNFGARWNHTAILDRYGFECSNTTYNKYRSYWTSDSAFADSYEDTYPILHYLRHAEQRTFKEIKQTVVKRGIVIWEIYNIGIVVKTDSLCFAMDLVARGSETLVPILDFAIVSHQYGDEFDKPFVNAMLAAGKTVYAPISYSNGGRSVVTIDSAMHVVYGEVSIRFTKGKEKPTVPALMSQIDFGPSTGDYTLYDVDDARPDFVPFKPTRHVDLMMLHIANGYSPTAAVDSIDPDIAWYSHIMELQHSTASNGYRWSYNYSYNKIQNQPHASSIILTWGESLHEAGAVVETAVRKSGAKLPERFLLEQNYPNPFNPSTEIRYHLSARSRVSLKVYDALGREVETLVSGIEAPGRYTVRFDGAGLASGVYFYRLSAGKYTKTMKMVLLK